MTASGRNQPLTTLALSGCLTLNTSRSDDIVWAAATDPIWSRASQFRLLQLNEF